MRNIIHKVNELIAKGKPVANIMRYLEIELQASPYDHNATTAEKYQNESLLRHAIDNINEYISDANINTKECNQHLNALIIKTLETSYKNSDLSSLISSNDENPFKNFSIKKGAENSTPIFSKNLTHQYQI